MKEETVFVAFESNKLRARGSMAKLVTALWPVPSARQADLRIFNEATGEILDLDWRGDAARVTERAEAQVMAPALGRPRLGVSSREITLLPRHWQWLDAQSGSVSATLRKLIDQQMAQGKSASSQVDSLYRQMSRLAGDLPQFEDAARCLYAEQWRKAEEIVREWPGDLAEYFTMRLRAVKKSANQK
jgi:hypothetical protein